MSVRSGGRKISFEVLADVVSGDEVGVGGGVYRRVIANGVAEGHGIGAGLRRRRARASKRKRKAAAVAASEVISGDGAEELDDRSVVGSGSVGEKEEAMSCPVSSIGADELRVRAPSGIAGVGGIVDGEVVTVARVPPSPPPTVGDEVSSITWDDKPSVAVNPVAEPPWIPAETGIGDATLEKEGSMVWNKLMTETSYILEANGHVKSKLEKEASLDWKKLTESSDMLGSSFVDKSPFKYFIDEIYCENSLQSTITVGNENRRRRVYNTMFHVPWRCERLILFGFFVCLDSFLSLLTIMPSRIMINICRILKNRRSHMPKAAELSDYGCFVVLALGVAALQRIDISLIYHVIRGQGTIKLYVVYNVLEIFDKLCLSLGEDVLQVLLNSAEGLSNCSEHEQMSKLTYFIFDEAIAVAAFTVHSFVLLAQATTLATCIIAHNNALLALLVSNNFSEIKSNVFKKFNKENIHNLVYHDIIERFHITAFLVFVLAQNVKQAEGPWLRGFFVNASMVCLCEVFIDAIKHSFLSKFNEIEPVAYSEFLEDLCKQILNKPDEGRKNLNFTPLAPACVVIRVLSPFYATVLPFGPVWWKIFWILLWSCLTYIMLAVCKILVGLMLRRVASWYVHHRSNQSNEKQHPD